MAYKNVLFDLDGTLTDPKVGITKSVKYALDKLGIIVDDIDSLKKFIGPPLKESFQNYYGMDDIKADDAIKYYREYFSGNGIFENELYENIEKVLSYLAKNNFTIIVATSKPRIFAEKIINHFNLTKYFLAIEGSELNGTRSDKGELIFYILNKYNLSAMHSIMIGDREHDIRGANKNSIDSIGVGYGYGTEEELVNSGAKYFVKNIDELSEILKKKCPTTASS